MLSSVKGKTALPTGGLILGKNGVLFVLLKLVGPATRVPCSESSSNLSPQYPTLNPDFLNFQQLRSSSKDPTVIELDPPVTRKASRLPIRSIEMVWLEECASTTSASNSVTPSKHPKTEFGCTLAPPGRCNSCEPDGSLEQVGIEKVQVHRPYPEKRVGCTR
jgi:hypothetical protein